MQKAEFVGTKKVMLRFREDHFSLFSCSSLTTSQLANILARNLVLRSCLGNSIPRLAHSILRVAHLQLALAPVGSVGTVLICHFGHLIIQMIIIPSSCYMTIGHLKVSQITNL